MKCPACNNPSFRYVERAKDGKRMLGYPKSKGGKKEPIRTSNLARCKRCKFEAMW